MSDFPDRKSSFSWQIPLHLVGLGGQEPKPETEDNASKAEELPTRLKEDKESGSPSKGESNQVIDDDSEYQDSEFEGYDEYDGEEIYSKIDLDPTFSNSVRGATPDALREGESYKGQEQAANHAGGYLAMLRTYFGPLNFGDDMPCAFRRDEDGGKVIERTILRETLDRTKWNGEGRPSEVQMYRKLPEHPRIVRVLAAIETRNFYDDTPYDDWTIVHRFATGGTLYDLEQAADAANEWIPEIFLWRTIKQTLEGFQALYESGRGHGNANHKSILFKFNPNMESQHLNVLLHNFSVQGFIEEDKELALRRDLGRFFKCLWQDVIERPGNSGLKTHPYSKELIEWTVRLMEGEGGLPLEKFSDVMQELSRQIEEHIKHFDPSNLPQWVSDHFKKTHHTLMHQPKLPTEWNSPEILIEQCEYWFNVWHSTVYRKLFERKSLEDVDDLEKAFRLRVIVDEFILDQEYVFRKPPYWQTPSKSRQKTL